MQIAIQTAEPGTAGLLWWEYIADRWIPLTKGQ